MSKGGLSTETLKRILDAEHNAAIEQAIQCATKYMPVGGIVGLTIIEELKSLKRKVKS